MSVHRSDIWLYNKTCIEINFFEILLNNESNVGLVSFVPSFSSLWTFIISFVSTFEDFFSKTCFGVSILVVDDYNRLCSRIQSMKRLESFSE